ncbi:MAG: DegT/DnrJ/EryC1/StrS family aminotransferase, partial [Lachnospiraceae bacterium]|nr:DegT/DnrJ/EryC1/StrS family aminotransferase [Lachnospiraceae bacterium]
KLKAFEDYELDDVNQAASWYTEALKDSSLVLPYIPEGFVSSWAQYTVQMPEGTDRASLQAALKEQGIPTMVYYIKPMHLQGAFEGTDSAKADCPATERLSGTVLSLPMHPYLREEDVQNVAGKLLKALCR